MGDRTGVVLTVLKSQQQLVQTIAEEHGESADEVLSNPPDNNNNIFTDFYFDEVNYGHLDFLPALQEAGVAYCSRWTSGGDYGPGEENCRYNDQGEVILQEVDDVDIGISPQFLMTIITNSFESSDEKYAKLVNIIKTHYDRVIPLPWENQEKNAKIFLTKKLLSE